MNNYSLTLHNMGEELYRTAREEARRKGMSLNKIIQEWARVGSGLKKNKKKRDLSDFVGTWTKKEGEAFDKYIEEAFEQIDEEDWK